MRPAGLCDDATVAEVVHSEPYEVLAHAIATPADAPALYEAGRWTGQRALAENLCSLAEAEVD